MVFIYAMEFVAVAVVMMIFYNRNKLLFCVVNRFVNMIRCVMLDFHWTWMNFRDFHWIRNVLNDGNMYLNLEKFNFNSSVPIHFFFSFSSHWTENITFAKMQSLILIDCRNTYCFFHWNRNMVWDFDFIYRKNKIPISVGLIF